MYSDDLHMDRYRRHLQLEGVGRHGQERLAAARVLVVGAGGLRSPVIAYLAAAGVGTIGIMDGDVVEPSNLNRQILHGEANLGQPKISSAAEAVARLDSHLVVESFGERLTAANALAMVRGYDLGLDCVDSFESKFLINDACVLARIPFVHCGVMGWGGQLFTHVPDGPCLRCLMPVIPTGAPHGDQVGILGAVAGTLGALEATEAIKHLTSAGAPLTARVLFADCLTMHFSEVQFKKNPRCPVCSGEPSITTLDPAMYDRH